MAQTFLLLFLFTCCTGTFAQAVLTQPPSASASSGGTVKISCTRSSGSITSNHVSWYQQKPGGAPRMIIYSFSSRPTGIPEQFSGSTDSSSNSAILTISGVQAEDEADYYCFSYVGNNQYIFGGGTQLTVTGQPAAPPTVNLFPPSSDELTSKSKATLVCLVDDFTPGAIDVTWLADGSPITSNVETTRPTKRNDKYVASSYLSLTAAEYEKKSEYTCKVTHDGKSYQKSVQREACSA